MPTQINAKLYQTGYSKLTGNDIASFLGKTFSVEEKAVAEDLIESCEDHIARACRRNFLVKDNDNNDVEYFETLDAGKYRYYLKNFPINTIKRIDLDGVQKYDSDNEATYGLYLGSDLHVSDFEFTLDWLFTSARDDRNALKVYYTIEEFYGKDVSLAIKRFVAEIFSSRSYGGRQVNNISVPQLSMGFDNSKAEKYFKSIVSRYKKVRF